MSRFIVLRDTGKGDVFEDGFDTYEDAQDWTIYMCKHSRDFQLDGKNARVWIEEIDYEDEEEG